MNTKHIAILSVAACMGLGTQTASAEILAGFHSFADAGAVSVTKFADEGTFGTDAEITYNSGSTSTGGSIDNWYGPDSGANGGFLTNQTPFNPLGGPLIDPLNPPTVNGPYLFQAAGGNARQLASYAATAPVPSNIAGGGASTADGRIRNFNGTDISLTNSTATAYRIDTLVFDAFVGDVSTDGATVTIEDFVLTRFLNDGTSPSELISVTSGFAGVNTPGETLDNPLGTSNLVSNILDFGVGTNYLDYTADLGGFILAPGESLSLGFNATGTGVARGDNFAVLGTAVPEPSSVLALGALFGVGVFYRRRRNKA